MSKPRTILVVDDDECLAGIIAEVLRSKGYKVWTASNGLDGYSCFLRHQTDLVLTDIQMPELDGFEMMRCVRSINPAVMTIYVSGSLQPYRAALESEKKEFGAVVLEKPFSSKDLVRIISQWPHEINVRESPVY